MGSRMVDVGDLEQPPVDGQRRETAQRVRLHVLDGYLAASSATTALFSAPSATSTSPRIQTVTFPSRLCGPLLSVIIEQTSTSATWSRLQNALECPPVDMLTKYYRISIFDAVAILAFVMPCLDEARTVGGACLSKTPDHLSLHDVKGEVIGRGQRQGEVRPDAGEGAGFRASARAKPQFWTPSAHAQRIYRCVGSPTGQSSPPTIRNPGNIGLARRSSFPTAGELFGAWKKVNALAFRLTEMQTQFGRRALRLPRSSIKHRRWRADDHQGNGGR